MIMASTHNAESQYEEEKDMPRPITHEGYNSVSKDLRFPHGASITDVDLVPFINKLGELLFRAHEECPEHRTADRRTLRFGIRAQSWAILDPRSIELLPVFLDKSLEKKEREEAENLLRWAKALTDCVETVPQPGYNYDAEWLQVQDPELLQPPTELVRNCSHVQQQQQQQEPRRSASPSLSPHHPSPDVNHNNNVARQTIPNQVASDVHPLFRRLMLKTGLTPLWQVQVNYPGGANQSRMVCDFGGQVCSEDGRQSFSLFLADVERSTLGCHKDIAVLMAEMTQALIAQVLHHDDHDDSLGKLAIVGTLVNANKLTTYLMRPVLCGNDDDCTILFAIREVGSHRFRTEILRQASSTTIVCPTHEMVEAVMKYEALLLHLISACIRAFKPGRRRSSRGFLIPELPNNTSDTPKPPSEHEIRLSILNEHLSGTVSDLHEIACYSSQPLTSAYAGEWCGQDGKQTVCVMVKPSRQAQAEARALRLGGSCAQWWQNVVRLFEGPVELGDTGMSALVYEMLVPMDPFISMAVRLPASATPQQSCAVILLQLGWDLLSALCCMAQLNIVHKDIKLSHMLYDYEAGRWKLIDFEHGGIADEQAISRCTGTSDYIAPELKHGDTHYSLACDWYSCGITLRNAAYIHSDRCARSIDYCRPTSELFALIDHSMAARDPTTRTSPVKALRMLYEGIRSMGLSELMGRDLVVELSHAENGCSCATRDMPVGNSDGSE